MHDAAFSETCFPQSGQVISAIYFSLVAQQLMSESEQADLADAAIPSAEQRISQILCAPERERGISLTPHTHFSTPPDSSKSAKKFSV